MERAGIGVIQYLESVALDQPPDQGERYRKREQRCSDERKREAGNHDAGLYPPITFAGVTSGAENSTQSQNRIKLSYTINVRTFN